MAWLELPPACAQSRFSYGLGSSTRVSASCGSAASWRSSLSTGMRSPGSGTLVSPKYSFQRSQPLSVSPAASSTAISRSLAMLAAQRGENLGRPGAYALWRLTVVGELGEDRLGLRIVVGALCQEPGELQRGETPRAAVDGQRLQLGGQRRRIGLVQRMGRRE